MSKETKLSDERITELKEDAFKNAPSVFTWTFARAIEDEVRKKYGARIKELERFELAYKEWSDKTEWVQRTAKVQELGKHRADVMHSRIEELEAENLKLEALCDATYVDRGADAYHHACEQMERYQEKRRKAGKEVGTTHSLCDGMDWVYGRLDGLEAQLEAVGAGGVGSGIVSLVGWQFVPTEDTPSMWTAGGEAIKGCEGHNRDAASLAYKAMLAAAPRPPQQIAAPAALEPAALEHVALEHVAIVAVSPGNVSVGWMGGYVPKHNDKLYTAPQPQQIAGLACWCQVCRPITWDDMRMVFCPTCGNKRCPRANDHRNLCTGSNEPGQPGSAYPSSPQKDQS